MIKQKLLGLILLSALVSCSNDDIQEINGTGKNLQFSLGISELKTKGLDPGADQEGLIKEVRKNIQSLRLEFKTANDVFLGSEKLGDEQIDAIKRNKAITIENIHTSTAKVTAYVNTVASEAKINSLQHNAGYELKHMEYEGTGEVTPSTDVNNATGNKLWKAMIPVTPALSRFEVKGDSELNVAKVPENNSNATREEVLKYFSEEIVKIKEAEAEKLCDEQVDKTHKCTYTYSLVFTPHYAGETIKVQEVYVNNIKNTRDTSGLTYFKGDGIDDWEEVAKTAYGETGIFSNMWDEYLLDNGNKKVAGYNLFPQSVSTNDLTAVKEGMPHIILKLAVIQGGITSPRWLTMRSFFEVNKNINRIIDFKAGHVYSLNLKHISLSRFTVSLQVSADNGGPTEPEIVDPDPTDPMPEAVDVDLEVGLEILDWEYVDVAPEL
ncbi:MAG: hypothetical protein ACRDD0_10780 [Bacteroidales bacterium]